MSYTVYREEEERRSVKRKTITQNLKLGQKKPEARINSYLVYQRRADSEEKEERRKPE